MAVLESLRARLETLLSSGSADNRRPLLGRGFESSVPGLHVIGDLAGAPVIKLAMAQGVEVVEHIASLPETKRREAAGDTLDVLIVGAGAAGLNAALAAQDHSLSCAVIEKGKIANTIEEFPEGKWVYAEPDSKPPKGKLWLDGAQKEDLVRRWNAIVADNDLDIRTEESLESIDKQPDGSFVARTSKGEYRARRIILATGQRGSPRKLGVPGEDHERVYHRLYSPRGYRDEDILVVGGGNSAVEAALTLAERNRVIISYRGGEFARIFKDNRRAVDEAIAAGRIEVVFHSNVKAFGPGEAELEIDRGGSRETRTVKADHAFVLGIRLENEWTGSFVGAALGTLAVLLGLWFLGGRTPLDVVPPWAGGLVAAASAGALLSSGIKGNRWSWLGISFLIWYSIYGIKVGNGSEFWPYRGWGYEAISFFDRPWAFWYTVLYTGLMTVFGFQALKRWGLDRRDRFQILRFSSLIAFQWFFFFIIPEYLFQLAVKHQWVGEVLANDPQFAEQAWRSYGLVYAWPLFFYTFFYDPHMVWVVWGVLLTFVVIPVLVIFAGKRYCSWICGCGGLAETFGDRWRHLAPKGKRSIRWEWMNMAILLFAVAATLVMLSRDVVGLIRQPAEWSVGVYRILVDVWLVGILPVTLYPFMGGKVWCRYWCPLAKLMGLLSHFYAKLGISRFKIVANDKCIACNECSRNCQVGIDVMQYALKQEVLDNRTSSCIGCGICVTVCPMDTLSYGDDDASRMREQDS
jgi:thioredoxin reductase/polyferredoxin